MSNRKPRRVVTDVFVTRERQDVRGLIPRRNGEHLRSLWRLPERLEKAVVDEPGKSVVDEQVEEPVTVQP